MWHKPSKYKNTRLIINIKKHQGNVYLYAILENIKDISSLKTTTKTQNISQKTFLSFSHLLKSKSQFMELITLYKVYNHLF